jgi:hypothetical protein
MELIRDKVEQGDATHTVQKLSRAVGLRLKARLVLG